MFRLTLALAIPGRSMHPKGVWKQEVRKPRRKKLFRDSAPKKKTTAPRQPAKLKMTNEKRGPYNQSIGSNSCLRSEFFREHRGSGLSVQQISSLWAAQPEVRARFEKQQQTKIMKAATRLAQKEARELARIQRAAKKAEQEAIREAKRAEKAAAKSAARAE